MNVKLCICDDQQMTVDALASWISRHAPDIQITASTRWSDALAAAEACDVVLLDVAMRDGIPVTAKIPVLVAAGCRVVVMSEFCDPATMASALAAGATAFIPKSAGAAEFLEVLHAARQGRKVSGASASSPSPRPHLTATQQRVARLYLADVGMSIAEVASQLGVSQVTVKTHIYEIRQRYRHLGVEVGTQVGLRRQLSLDGFLD